MEKVKKKARFIFNLHYRFEAFTVMFGEPEKLAKKKIMPRPDSNVKPPSPKSDFLFLNWLPPKNENI